MIDADVPYTITGPAIVNILDATPVTYPSLFASIDGDVTAFENPVIGTNAPAPPNFAILSKKPKPVKSEARNINDIEAYKSDFSLSAPKFKYSCESPSPKQQIAPPTINAFMQFIRHGERSARFSIYSLYCLFVIETSFIILLYSLLLSRKYSYTLDFFQYLGIIKWMKGVLF